ncbi:nuclear transport factor 2 family protein [Epilithonimonas xixisoli]|uniref:Putative lumazine-binding protein n=1 Tax=Epilithonimonas xixisoli TaxID=1476462 RepID=A0A4R8IAX9_9FLAO|nr:nuclear transport factor 2 family protein [Epilithonimonas xixisoli]TDX87187.1 putative lumazine-binding protein [Epilithonimonas xixisoli]
MKIGILLLSLLPILGFSQTSEEALIKASINGLFDGMKTSDSSKISKAFSKSAILQTITKNGEVKSENIKDFAVSISKAEKGSLEEKITFSNILIDGIWLRSGRLMSFIIKGNSHIVVSILFN